MHYLLNLQFALLNIANQITFNVSLSDKDLVF